MNKSDKIKILREKIKKYAPVVAEFFDKEENIIDFSRGLYEYNVNNVYLERQKILSKTISDYVNRLFNAKIEINRPLISNIVDHHSILNHPILIATNIVGNAHRLLDNNKNPIIVLTSSIVPPNNFFNKKGFLFHGKKIPLFSNKDMHQASCFIKLHNFNFTKKIKDIGQWDTFSTDEQIFLKEIENGILDIKYPAAQNYNDQISLINNFLWKKLFHKDIRGQIPELYYLTQEDIMRLLLPSILNENNIVSQAIFDDRLRPIILEKFKGLAGCWDENNKKGTHFFWYKDDKNEASRLYLRNDLLISEDGKKRILLDKEKIINLIKKEELIPNLFVIFSYITYWCGLRPLVGHGSCNYLTKMKEAWLEILNQTDKQEYDRLIDVDTKGLIGGEIVTYKRNTKNEIEVQYAFDVISNGGLTKEYLDSLLTMKYKDLLKPALLEIYESYVPAGERANLGLKSMDMMGEEFNWIK